MKAIGHPQRIILAIDLKAEDLSLTEKLWKAVKPILAEGAVVEPVSILNREDAAIGNVLKSRIGKLRTATERHLADQLQELGLKNLAAPKVLFADGSSTQRAVMTLLSYAKKSGCELIAVSSHSRKGVKRFFLGSFAETLSLQSTIPILVVGATQRKVTAKSKTILFPTDFSDKSKEGLEMVCDYFKNHKPKIVLFHSYLSPTPIYIEPFFSYPLPQSVIEEDFARTKKLGKTWCSELRAKGISCALVMDRKSPFVAGGILSAARRQKVTMVAMVSNTGRVGAALLGSATREVLRDSPCPVWVVHPFKKVEKKVVSLKRPKRVMGASDLQATATK